MAELQPVDFTDQTDLKTNQGQQVLIMAAAAVYGQAYNAARALHIPPVEARVEARNASLDFINMELTRA